MGEKLEGEEDKEKSFGKSEGNGVLVQYNKISKY